VHGILSFFAALPAVFSGSFCASALGMRVVPLLARRRSLDYIVRGASAGWEP